MRKHQEEAILDGEKYTLVTFTTTNGLTILSRLTKLLGVPFVSMVGLNKKTGNSNLAEILPVVMGAFVDRMGDDEKIVKLVRDLLDGVVFEGQKVGNSALFDTQFQGRIGHMLELLTKVVRFNFEDFLSVLARAGSAELMRARQSDSTSPST